MFDWEFILQSIPAFSKALWLTLHLSFFGIALAIIFGFFVALVQYYKIKYLKTFVNIYVEISRNTPMLIQLFFIYYGLSRLGLKLEAYTCAICAVVFLGGSYMAESFRSGFEAVSKIQIESAKSLGLENLQILFFITLPQALVVSLPYIGANVIFLLKETSVVTAIALPDVLYVTKDIIGTYSKTNEAFLLLIACYLIVLLPISILFSGLEKYYKKRL
ncbi:polar amino acid ABC transporter permease [Helicobacter valdiviensis]|uniref:Polar amino acid ABC transporter permease n=1 Tax=Helicobacter valdiviensis TaxID=1458358 RepID=A0A2W6NNS6_9HELI|nr:amino acid ABC transporter permease [Helicobacter valdiviensis]PZT49116.1 polar amino acid ABC transporter permease [Helicobacter valdiviensis]